MITVTSLVKTCPACPAQWEGLTADDRQIYVRYRWGSLTIQVSEPGDKTEHGAVRGEYVFAEAIGNPYDGFLDEERLFALTAEHVNWPKTDWHIQT